jgi:hypothetical protein
LPEVAADSCCDNTLGGKKRRNAVRKIVALALSIGFRAISLQDSFRELKAFTLAVQD